MSCVNQIRSKIGLAEIAVWFVMLFCICLPPYGPTNQNFNCSRENSDLIRRFLRTKWYPVLDRYGARLPLDCPLHPQREIFWRQEAAKRRHRNIHWTCGFCGKSFQTEKNIDQHMERKHDDCLYLSEDAICLADYCDILRCDVLEAIKKHDSKNPKPEVTTDVELWKDNVEYKKALQRSPSRDLTLYKRNKKSKNFNGPIKCSEMKQHQYNIFILTREKYQNIDENCSPASSDCVGCGDKVNGTVNATDPLMEDTVWTAYKRQRSQCNEEDMKQIRERCEDLVDTCTMGLLVTMSNTDFKDLHGMSFTIA